jgi:C_GCAxxG_C_C family probable redox protein
MLAVGGHLIEDMHPRCVCMSTPFGGGIGGSHEELCGAFTAGLMIIGALHGRSDLAGDDTAAYSLAKEFRLRFRDEWGTLICDSIRDWAKGPLGPGGCAGVVSRSAELLMELLQTS